VHSRATRAAVRNGPLGVRAEASPILRRWRCEAVLAAVGRSHLVRLLRAALSEGASQPKGAFLLAREGQLRRLVTTAHHPFEVTAPARMQLKSRRTP
jgi:hypothetical protein